MTFKQNLTIALICEILASVAVGYASGSFWWGLATLAILEAIDCFIKLRVNKE